MEDETTETSEVATTDETETPEDDQPAELGDAGKKAIDRMKAERNAAQAQAKALEKELEEIKRSQMTDQEKAIAEARAEARAEALAEAGSNIAAAEFKAAAAGRLEDDQLTTLLDGLDLKAFLTDGQVDTAKIASFMDGIAPPQGERRMTSDLGQGARTTSTALNGDPLLRDLKSKLGIG